MYNRQHTFYIYKPLQSCRHWPELTVGSNGDECSEYNISNCFFVNRQGTDAYHSISFRWINAPYGGLECCNNIDVHCTLLAAGVRFAVHRDWSLVTNCNPIKICSCKFSRIPLIPDHEFIPSRGFHSESVASKVYIIYNNTKNMDT